MFNRLNGLFSENVLNKLNSIKVLLVGVGGVGSFCLEALVRSGIKNITIIDFDEYEESNLNRQLHSNKTVIKKKKVDVLKDEMLLINNDLNINALDMYVDDKSNIDFNNFDYIIDACDSIKAKILLITKAKEYNKKIIVSLGVGNRINPKDLEITTLKKTINDPLGKKLRHELNKIDFTYEVKVISSKELPKKINPVSSYIGVSATAGLLLADYVVKDVYNEYNGH